MKEQTRLQKLAQLCAIISTFINITNFSFQVTRYYLEPQVVSPPVVNCSAEINKSNKAE